MELAVLITVWLTVGLLVLIALLFFQARFLAPTAAAPAVEAIDAVPSSALPAPESQSTAKNIYPAAETAARLWQSDVRLISASATWSKTALNLLGKPTAWIFRFYSPSRERLYFVVINADGSISGTQHHLPIGESPPEVTMADWQVDSPQALQSWLSNGGEKFLGQNPGSEVIAQIKAGSDQNTPMWTLAGFNSQNNAFFTILLDAQKDMVVQVIQP